MKHTPGPWKTLPCPIHKGKHILQDHRWIATENAAVEYSPYVKNDWCLSSGSLICQMMDTQHQPYDAKLIAAAPDLLQACKKLLNVLESEPECAIYKEHAKLARKAIAKATE